MDTAGYRKADDANSQQGPRPDDPALAVRRDRRPQEEAQGQYNQDGDGLHDLTESIALDEKRYFLTSGQID